MKPTRPKRFERVLREERLCIYTYRRFVGDIAVGYTFPVSLLDRARVARKLRECRRNVLADQRELENSLTTRRRGGAGVTYV